MILIEVFGETPAGSSCLITLECILMGGLVSHTRFIQSADATLKRASQPITCNTGPIKAVKGELKRRRILSKGSSLLIVLSLDLTLFQLMRVNQNMIVGWRDVLQDIQGGGGAPGNQ